MDDHISRQAAIDALDKRFDSIPMEQTTEILLLRKDLRDLPTAEPQRIKGKWALQSDVESDVEQVRKEAYQKGYETGYEDGYNEPGKNQQEAYQRGLADAWEAARKICSMDSVTRDEIFGMVITSNIIDENTAAEVIEKLKAHEQKHEEIKVGDEVQFKNTGSKFVVTRIFASEEGRKCEGLFDDGEVYESVLDGGNVEKTGRTFPEIAAVLEKMRGEQDG